MFQKISFSAGFNLHKFKTYYGTSSLSVFEVIQKGSVGDHINIKGWVKSLRKQKEHTFIDINDGSSENKLQILVPHKLTPENLTTGSSVIASGRLNLSPKGQLEVAAENIKVCGPCVIADGYPFAPRKQYPPEYIRQYLHFRPRTSKFSSLLRVRHNAHLAFHKFLDSEGYVNIQTPVLTSNDCEGAGEVFKVLPDNELLLKSMVKENCKTEDAFFGSKTYLTVSGQLQLEAAAHGVHKVFTFGPSFRAENSRTRLHLSEFYMLEVEIAFVDKLECLLKIVETMLKNVTHELLKSKSGDMKICRDNSEVSYSWLDRKFPIVSYEEAVDILKSAKQNIDEENGISKENELYLVKHFDETPVFIIDWPKRLKPFYMSETENDSSKVAAFDLLAPGVGEIVGGSLREHNYDKLQSKLPSEAREHLNWYLELRKFGGVPTGGFGLGFERYLLFALGINNIKDVIPFPRWPHHCFM